MLVQNFYVYCTTIPQVQVVHITSESYTGKKISEVYPHLRGLYDQELISMKDMDTIANDSDFVFIWSSSWSCYGSR